MVQLKYIITYVEDSSATVKSPSRHFSQNKSTMTVQIEPGDPSDSLAKVESQFS